MERSVGVEEARARLGQLADTVARDREPIVVTRRGRAVAVLLSTAEYEQLLQSRRQLAQLELQARLARIRNQVAAAGIDVSVVDEAIAAARELE